MSTFLRSVLVAIALFTGASAAVARPAHESQQYSQQRSDTDAAWAFWDAQQRNGS